MFGRRELRTFFARHRRRAAELLPRNWMLCRHDGCLMSVLVFADWPPIDQRPLSLKDGRHARTLRVGGSVSRPVGDNRLYWGVLQQIFASVIY